MTNFARSKLTKPDVDEPGEIVEIPASVTETKALLCAARLENSLDHNDFKQLVDEFEASVRHDERERIKFEPKIGNIGSGLSKAKWMKPDDAEKIRVDAAAYLKEHGRSKLPPGYAQRVANEYGYTQGQVQSAIYSKGK